MEDLGFLGSNIVKAEAGKMHAKSEWTACFNINWHTFLRLIFKTRLEEEHDFFSLQQLLLLN